MESKSDRKDIESAPENMEIYDKSSPVNHEIITSEKNQEILIESVGEPFMGFDEEDKKLESNNFEGK